MKIFLLLFLSSYIALQAQSKDSLKVLMPKDSVKNKITDSLSVNDTSKIIQKPDTAFIIYQKPFDSNSNFINRTTFDRIDYRYAGDLFKSFSLNFTRDYGSIGQPNESLFYGLGFWGVSYFVDGILQNDRFPNQFDLNEIQTESIDSIEIIPSPRGFLYGDFNNSASVNFISRNIYMNKPYSKIKYYQGANGEALVDFLFSDNFYKRINLSLDVTNRKLDSVFSNTGYSDWQVNLKLKYFISDNFNLIASYNFVHSEIGLSGGVNYDSLVKSGANINTALYDYSLAPVISPYKHLSIKTHYFNLRLLSSYSASSFTDVNIYYKFNQNNTTDPSDTLNLQDENKNNTLGISARQDFNESIFNLSINGIFESTGYNNQFINYNILSTPSFRDKVLSLSSVLTTTILDSTLSPSVFIKYSDRSLSDNLQTNAINYGGYGFDLSYMPIHNLRFYLGYSNYQTEISKNYINNFEAAAQFTLENLFLRLDYFKRNNFINNNYPFISNYIYVANLQGLGINVNYNIWNIYFETAASFYRRENSPSLLYELPQTSFTLGVFYKDILFDSNLNLKTGFIAYYNGELIGQTNIKVPSSLKIDYTLSGEIRKVAMVYFTWENLLNRQYYIIPYYPMPGRSIRFGISWELFN